MSNSRTARRAVSLRERLAARRRPHTSYVLQVDDTAPALRLLADAMQQLQQAMAAQEETDGAQAALEQARSQLDVCHVAIALEAMRPGDYEALIAANPPTAEQRTAGESWNPDTFRPALLAACADGDMTAQDWAEFLTERCSQGEQQDLWVTALALNSLTRMPEALTLPKGSTPTRS